jgi:hypothetical protein
MSRGISLPGSSLHAGCCVHLVWCKLIKAVRDVFSGCPPVSSSIRNDICVYPGRARYSCMSCFLLYVAARYIIVIEAFIALRSLPPAAYGDTELDTVVTATMKRMRRWQSAQSALRRRSFHGRPCSSFEELTVTSSRQKFPSFPLI